MTNEEIANIVREEAAKQGLDGNTAYLSAMAASRIKDEQFAKEKKEIDEQWKRLMAESKSIGVDLLQCKEEQYKKEKQQLIDKACKLMQHWILEHDYVDIMELEDYVKQKMEDEI